MRLFSYVVARDYGFAPNPFHGICTLATCKPSIRSVAQRGDLVVGTGAACYGLSGRLVFAMLVSGKLTYDEYWSDARFERKKPDLSGSFKQAYGDNIYHRMRGKDDWLQEDSHHSLPGGGTNAANLVHDTKTDAVLLAENFVYWGGQGPTAPSSFRDHGGVDICAGRHHKSRFPVSLVEAVYDWFSSLEERGCVHLPREFDRYLTGATR